MVARMDDPLSTTLFITLIGMTVVFLAMVLIYASMRILTRATSEIEKPPVVDGPETSPPLTPVQDAIADTEQRAAAVAVALARADSTVSEFQLGGNTAWGDFYRQRQLRPGVWERF